MFELSVNKEEGRSCPEFMSRSFLSLVMFGFIIIIYVFWVKSTLSSGPFESMHDTFELSDNINPDYIVQLTDLHSHHKIVGRMDHITNMIKNISEFYNPKIVVMTGDLVDASNTTFPVYYHQQFEENWIAFNKSIHDSGILKDGRNVIFVPGNHDTMVVPDDTPVYNYYRKYLLKEGEDFEMREYLLSSPFKDLHIVAFDPLKPPVVSGPLGLMPHINKKLVNRLEKSINKSYINVYLCHFPYFTTWGPKSSTGKSVGEIIQEFDSGLTGHYHPRSAQISRFGNTLTVVSSPTFQSRKFSINAIDHGYQSIHEVESDSRNKLIITYPIKYSQITSRVDFSKKSFPIRGLFFGDVFPNSSVLIDGSSCGNLVSIREIRNGVHLVRLHVYNLSEGEHKLEISGMESFTFFIGEKTNDFSEKERGLVSLFMLYPTLLFLLVFFVIYSGIKLIPLWKLGFVEDSNNQLSDYVNGANSEYSSLKLVFSGPLYLITRLHQSPRSVYLVLVFLYLWVFVCPIYFARIKYMTVSCWIYGMYANGSFTPFPMLFLIIILYHLLFLQPLIGYAGIIHDNGKHSSCQKNFLLSLAFFWIVVWAGLSFFAGITFTMMTSPMLYISTIGLILVLVLSSKKDESPTKSSIQGVLLI